MKTTETRFRRDLYIKSRFAHQKSDWSPSDLYVKSDWNPDTQDIPAELRARTSYFLKCLKNGFLPRRKCPSNLTPLQHYVMLELTKIESHVILLADKGLGPVIMERYAYVAACLSLLLNENNYEQLDEINACYQSQKTVGKVEAWMKKFDSVISDGDLKFLVDSLALCDKFEKRVSHFYILAKIHKKPWKPRPINSYSGSTLYGLGKVLDKLLQPIAKRLPYYLKDSFSLRDQVLKEPFNPSCDRWFVADAKAMYDNIDTTHALEQFREFFNTSDYVLPSEHAMTDCIIEALDILMNNNIIQFDDLFFRQKNGTAMGAPPAPPYATIYFAIHELKIVPKYESLVFYKRYIDDALGLWRRHANPVVDLSNWTKFQADMNDYGILTWDPFTQETTVNFMDLTIFYDTSSERTETKVYEKPENLYLIIPPRSAHAPGVLKGSIIGTLYRYKRICSRIKDFYNQTEKYFHRIIARGHKPSNVQKHFRETYDYLPTMKPKERPSSVELAAELKERIFLHLDYHPFEPNRRSIQALAQSTLLSPKNEPTLENVANGFGGRVGVKRLVVAYHRTRNIKDYLIPRKFGSRPGPSASTYIASYRLQCDIQNNNL